MSDPTDPEDVDLGVSLETVATIVDHARAIQGREDADAEELDEDADSQAALLTSTDEDATEDTLAEFIDELNEDEQIALVALAWTGRGDYEAAEWEEARRLAAERNAAGDTSGYLLGLDLLGDLLAEGVAAFGLSIEEVER